MTTAQFQQSGARNQRQDVPIVADTFEGNMQQQIHERFSLGSDRAFAQAAAIQQQVKNTDIFTQQYPVSGPLQTSSVDLESWITVRRCFVHHVGMYEMQCLRIPMIIVWL